MLLRPSLCPADSSLCLVPIKDARLFLSDPVGVRAAYPLARLLDCISRASVRLYQQSEWFPFGLSVSKASTQTL